MREGAGGRGASRSWRGRSTAPERLLPAWRKALAAKGILRLRAGCPQPYPHFPGTTWRLGECVWAFLDHPLQVPDVQGKSRAALILSSCLSTECWDKCTGRCEASAGVPQSPFGRWISAPGIGQTMDCAVFDRCLQVLGTAGFFAPAPQLSSSFSTVGGDMWAPTRRALRALAAPRGGCPAFGRPGGFFFGAVLVGEGGARRGGGGARTGAACWWRGGLPSQGRRRELFFGAGPLYPQKKPPAWRGA
ncbi:Uncharacterised protein [Achromobacter xylosoxidans]|nr:Uncharacterised protein [Achromobacter xylosoxidans]